MLFEPSWICFMHTMLHRFLHTLPAKVWFMVVPPWKLSPAMLVCTLDVYLHRVTDWKWKDRASFDWFQDVLLHNFLNIVRHFMSHYIAIWSPALKCMHVGVFCMCKCVMFFFFVLFVGVCWWGDRVKSKKEGQREQRKENSKCEWEIMWYLF